MTSKFILSLCTGRRGNGSAATVSPNAVGTALASEASHARRVLGIGTGLHSNTDLWLGFFSAAERIVLCDSAIGSVPADQAMAGDGRVLLVADVTDQEATEIAVRASSSAFDFVLDDGRRSEAERQEAFVRYLPLLAPGGAYGLVDVDPFTAAALLARLGPEVGAKVRTIEFVGGMCIVRTTSKPAGGEAEDRSTPEGSIDPAERARIAELQRAAFRRSYELLKLQTRLEQVLTMSAREAAVHAGQIAEIHASTSWRATIPLRWAGAVLRHVRTLLRRLREARQRHGTVGALSLAAERLRARGPEQSAAVLAQQGGRDYAEWVRRYDTIGQTQCALLSGFVDAMPRKPLISILMPVYNPDLAWLSRAIASVQAQVYPHWELCIADDASRDPACRKALDGFAAQDARIKVVYRASNGHISAASNSALTLATGEWTALMDQDDLLPVHALFWVAQEINEHAEARLIYSDEDKIGPDDQRFDPYFKSDWNPDLFYSQNMFSHFGVFETALLRQIGGFRTGFEGAQDYDLVLRSLERVRADQIRHIPKVLYHWRVHAESTASSKDAKPYAQLAGERALNEHFVRAGIRGHVTYAGNGYHAHYDLPDPAPLVSLIIPTRNAMQLVRQCVDSIEARTTYPNYEFILVDNGSDDPESLAYFETLKQRPNFRVIRDDSEFNYSKLNNMAVAAARGDVVGLINNDIEVITPDWLSEMVGIACQPGVGAVGARLWYPDHTLQHGGVVLGIGGVAGHAHKRLPMDQGGYFERAALIQSFSVVTAACLIVQKKHYLAVNGLNESELKVAFNDVDFCLRLREAGLRNVWTPYAELFHHESATRGEDTNPEKQQRFAGEVRYMMERWGDALTCDPAYNPNLTLIHEDFSLAWPPLDR